MSLDELYVFDHIGRPVAAKRLRDFEGNYVINPDTGTPYIVPRDYSIQDSIDLGNEYRDFILNHPSTLTPVAGGPFFSYMELGSEKIVPGFRAGGSQDLQRTYNNVANGGGAEFVSAFTDIASFHLGFALRVAGFHPEVTTAAGGFYNLRNLFEEDISVTWRWGINSHLPADIYAGADFYSTGRWAPEPIINPLRNTRTGLPCFAAGTPILLADGTSRAIEEIVAGDAVAAFNENESLGRAKLRPATVARLLPGVTEEWIVLEDGTRVTPGHRYLTEHGTWATAAELIGSDVRAVAADGTLVPLRGTLLRASDAGSDAEWITPEPYADGGNLVQPAPVFGRRTYNFEVAELHTCVAANENGFCERKVKVA